MEFGEAVKRRLGKLAAKCWLEPLDPAALVLREIMALVDKHVLVRAEVVKIVTQVMPPLDHIQEPWKPVPGFLGVPNIGSPEGYRFFSLQIHARFFPDPFLLAPYPNRNSRSVYLGISWSILPRQPQCQSSC